MLGIEGARRGAVGQGSHARRRRHEVLVAVLAVVLGVLASAQAAWATELELPKGAVAKITNASFRSCNDETYGYQLDGGPGVELANTPGGCREVAASNATIGPFEADETLTFYLTDNTCGLTFHSNGGEHAEVTGANPFEVQLWDAGGFCEYKPGVEDPDVPPGNLEATVTIDHAPEPPEFGRCVKIAGKSGEYADSKCTKHEEGESGGKYEWLSGPGAANKFTTSGGASVFFETREGYSGSCASVTGAGEYVSGGDDKHLTATYEWAGCKVISSPNGVINGASCQSAERPAGDVVSSPLVGEVGWENKAKKATALLLEPAEGAGDVFSRWECGGFDFATTTHGRGLLVPIKNDAMKGSETLKYKEKKGIQVPSTWHVGEPAEETTFLEDNEPIPFGRSGIGFQPVLTNEEALELNAVV